MEESVVKERECGSRSSLPADGDSSSLPLKVIIEHKMVTLVHTVQPVYHPVICITTHAAVTCYTVETIVTTPTLTF